MESRGIPLQYGVDEISLYGVLISGAAAASVMAGAKGYQTLGKRKDINRTVSTQEINTLLEKAEDIQEQEVYSEITMLEKYSSTLEDLEDPDHILRLDERGDSWEGEIITTTQEHEGIRERYHLPISIGYEPEVGEELDFLTEFKNF